MLKPGTRVLITGGSGFIGTNMVDYFTALEGVEVVNIDCVQPRNKLHFKYWRAVDLLDEQALNASVSNFDPHYIIHMAARTDLNGATINDYNANTVGVRNILQAARACVSLKKIIITSSMLVCRAGYQPTSQFDYAPSTIYGESKVQTEQVVWQNPPQCDWAIVRPTSIWGPWFGEPYKNFFDMVIAGRYFHIGNRSCTKTYGYVGNAVYQVVRILVSDTTNSTQKVYYLGDTPATNIKEWADEIAAALGKHIYTMPYWLLKVAAWCGDFLKLCGVRFPMTSFRLKNMTTNNEIDLSETSKIAPNPPVCRKDAIRETLKWISTDE